ncbi:MAG: hypothetical protein N3F64_05305 [Nitrososphaeria archaeon]|nr:hypothetical protein [Nitrososphaeria archaeon]
MVRRKRKGQLLIFAGVILTLLIFYIAVTVHNTSTTYQNLRYEEVKEIVDNFNEDFRRSLRYILAAMTQEYNATAEMDTPRYNAFERFTLWMKTAIRTFSARGIQVNFTFNKVLLQPQKLLFGKLNMPARYVYDLTKLYWYSPQSISAISANFSLSVPGSGFYGWKGQMLVLLNMTVYVNSIENDRQLGTKVTITLNKEYGEPIEDLTAKNFKISYFDKSTSKWENAKIVTLLNNGGGNYTIYFKSVNDKIIDEPYNRYIIVWAVDNRGIIVESYTYTAVEYVIQENAINPFYPGVSKPEEVYALEVILNGTILWFNRQLAFSGTYPPIPMPPVKQFRVYSTTNGPTDPNLKEIPSQVEVWTSNYLVPTLKFAEWRRRFSVGDKLVFLLNYSNPGVYQQKVRIEWLWDADTPPPTYLVRMNSTGIYVDIYNQRYTLRLVPNEGFSFAIDWTFSMYYKNYHVEYSMNGIGYIGIPGGYWIPHILPAGNWTVLVGPIRAVAYRDTSRTYRVEYQNGYKEYYDDPGPFKHTEIALIPYKTKYWQLYNDIIWLRDHTDGRYYSYLTMISGTSGDQGSPIRISHWAHQMTDLSVHWGTYSSSHSTHDRDQNFLYWYAQYNYNGFGEAVLPSKGYVDSIKSLIPGNRYEMWIWTSADYARRVIDCLAQRFDTSGTMTIRRGTVISWFAGVWAYEGNGYSEPNMYHRMFVETYFPTIVSVSAAL